MRENRKELIMTSLLVLAPAIISAIAGAQSKTPVQDNAYESGVPNAIQQVYVDTEEAEIGTKCYVDNSSVNAVQALGWDVHVDRRGFYYETTAERQKIVGVRTLSSQLQELREKLVVAENTTITVQTFTGNPDPFKMNNATLGYARSFNKNYALGGEQNTFAWLATAGPIDGFVNSIVDGIGGCEYYFSQFVSNNDFGVSYHNSEENPHANERNDDNAFSLFTDPITNTKKIDLIHMFASLDGCYDWTLVDALSGQLIPNLLPEMVHDLASWGGDLQTAANRIQAGINGGSLSLQTVQNWTFQNIMCGSYGCSEADMLADVDAVNIADSYLTGPGRSSDALADYYGSTYSNYSRFQKFISSVNNDQNVSWVGTPNERFELEIYNVLGLEKSGSTWVTSGEYTDSSISNIVKFSIAKKSGINPSQAVRMAVAEKFCNYVFSLC